MDDTDDELNRTLAEIDREWCGRSRRGCFYSRHGDSVFAYLEQGAHCRDPIDAHLTLFRALDDGRIVGFQVADVQMLCAAPGAAEKGGGGG